MVLHVYMTMMTLVTIDRAILIMMTHMMMRSGMVVMVPWKVKCVIVPAGRKLVGLSSPESGPVTGQLALCLHQNRRLPRLEINHCCPISKLNHTGPSSVWDAATSLPLRCTHRNRMKLGCRSSTLVWDRQPGKDLMMSDRLWSFICPKVRSDTEGGDRSPLEKPDFSGGPGGATDPDRTVLHYVNQITDFAFDKCVQGTFSVELSCIIVNEMTYQEKIDTLHGALCDYHDICDTQPDCFACDDTHDCG